MMNAKVITELSFIPKILVIDDEKRIRDGCKKTLLVDSFEVATAESGFQGLKQLEMEHFDIILLDLMMPGLSGMEVLQHVREAHPDTVVIVITGYATLEHAVEAMKKGAFDFISKPFSPDDLRNVIKKAMEHIRTLYDIAIEKSRMRALINQLSSGVLATNNQKQIALANTAFLKLIKHRDEVLGHPVNEIIINKELLEMIDQALLMNKDDFVELSKEIYFQGKRKEDDLIVNARCVPYMDRAGRVLGTITVLYDITDLKKKDQQKSDFVSMVSHEVRNPMNSVLAQLKVVLDGLAGDLTEKQCEMLHRASEKIMSLVNLSTELLDLARIESGLITQEKEKVDMARLLEEQIAFHMNSAVAKHIHLELSPLPDIPFLMANRYNIEEVFSNLISNSITYTPKGGKITLSASIENDFLCVNVTDTGLGIPEKDMDHIFDKFYRVKNDNTRYITGTGLGLSIVKSIVEAHNGMVNVKSVEGQGSSFNVYLPILAE